MLIRLGAVVEKLSVGNVKIEEGTDWRSLAGVPRIVLEGRWLEEAGFKAGEVVKIAVLSEGEIKLTRAEGVQ